MRSALHYPASNSTSSGGSGESGFTSIDMTAPRRTKMSATTRKNDAASDTWTTTHPLSPEDSAAIALRSVVAGHHAFLEG
jgi:hypothetical protein